MTVRYTPEAIADLREMKDYISRTLRTPSAAKRLTSNILDACSLLKDFPQSGTPLEALTGLPGRIRYIISENRRIFYRTEGAYIMIIRILDGRTDYLRLLMKEK